MSIPNVRRISWEWNVSNPKLKGKDEHVTMTLVAEVDLDTSPDCDTGDLQDVEGALFEEHPYAHRIRFVGRRKT